MQNLSDISKVEKLHHFNIIEGGTESIINELCENILNFKSKANPNYFYKKYDSFFVDDSRELIELQNRKHKTEESAVFVIECGSINHQAQNALLKVFEESKTGTYFFLIIPQSNILLPTFLSRAVVYKSDKSNESVESSEKKDPNTFQYPTLSQLQKIPIKDRMDLVTKLLADYKKEKISKTDLKKFLNNLIDEINEEVLNGNLKLINNLEKIEANSKFFDNNGAHLKSLLEFTMLTI